MPVNKVIIYLLLLTRHIITGGGDVDVNTISFNETLCLTACPCNNCTCNNFKLTVRCPNKNDDTIILTLLRNSNVHIVDFSRNFLKRQPLLEPSPYIQKIVFDHNSLTELSSLANLPNLEYVSYEDNHLSGFPDIFLSPNTKLKTFIANGNRLLTSLPERIFENATELNFVSMARTNMSDLNFVKFIPNTKIILNFKQSNVNFLNSVIAKSLIDNNHVTYFDAAVNCVCPNKGIVLDCTVWIRFMNKCKKARQSLFVGQFQSTTQRSVNEQIDSPEQHDVVPTTPGNVIPLTTPGNVIPFYYTYHVTYYNQTDPLYITGTLLVMLTGTAFGIISIIRHMRDTIKEKEEEDC